MSARGWKNKKMNKIVLAFKRHPIELGRQKLKPVTQIQSGECCGREREAHDIVGPGRRDAGPAWGASRRTS